MEKECLSPATALEQSKQQERMAKKKKKTHRMIFKIKAKKCTFCTFLQSFSLFKTLIFEGSKLFLVSFWKSPSIWLEIF